MTPPKDPSAGRSSAAASERLNVIALISGGKDSFFSLLHCIANGHSIVALANLHPGSPPRTIADPRDRRPDAISSPSTTIVLPGRPTHESNSGSSLRDQEKPRDQALEAGAHASTELGEQDGGPGGGYDDETDLNSFMYQTVGHQVIPLYAAATGIPLYRQPIAGTAIQHAREYAWPQAQHKPTAGPPTGHESTSPGGDRDCESIAGDMDDETESMIPLLLAIKKAHPEANAISAGAILSTYQRTRVESIALRLGLVPLAYLWQFPVLPLPRPSVTTDQPGTGSGGDDTQLLCDLAAAGVEARIIKVASGGLDESFLWENVADPAVMARLKRAMGRFGSAEKGAVLGEGGEFETLVTDGPAGLFRGRIVVGDEDRRVVREGGGAAWLSIDKASVVFKETPEPESGEHTAGGHVRRPDLLDPRFAAVSAELSGPEPSPCHPSGQNEPSYPRWKALLPASTPKALTTTSHLSQWNFTPSPPTHSSGIAPQTHSLVAQIRARLAQHSLPPTRITNTLLLLRHMADFPTVNTIYAPLFPAPNPPARVTISCGAHLPPGVAIAVSVTVAHTPAARHGLHVQSRSYWAPANIGPYSQAVAVELGGGCARLVSVAGQIPLVPSTMALPPPEQGFAVQLVLALQHLWRVGVEMGVQWWSCAAAYIPRGDGAREKAVLAARAWRGAHLWGQAEVDEEVEGPDLWDRRFDKRYMVLGSERRAGAGLPDWEALSVPEDGGPEDWRPVPLMWVAEVEELPRGAGVEWHAQVGFGGVGERGVRCSGPVGVKMGDGKGAGRVQHTVLMGEEDWFVQSVVAWDYPGPGEQYVAESLLRRDVLVDSFVELTGWNPWAKDGVGGAPERIYVDVGALGSPVESVLNPATSPVVPCFSLWGSQGDRLAAVVIYNTIVDTRRDVS